MQILEMASNIILRLFCHLKACLKRFQRAYRAQILCEELKLKKYSHFITSLKAIGVLFFTRGHLRLFCHLKACLNWFQKAYRAHILCEELNWKNRANS